MVVVVQKMFLLVALLAFIGNPVLAASMFRNAIPKVFLSAGKPPAVAESPVQEPAKREAKTEAGLSDQDKAPSNEVDQKKGYTVWFDQSPQVDFEADASARFARVLFSTADLVAKQSSAPPSILQVKVDERVRVDELCNSSQVWALVSNKAGKAGYVPQSFLYEEKQLLSQTLAPKSDAKKKSVRRKKDKGKESCDDSSIIDDYVVVAREAPSVTVPQVTRVVPKKSSTLTVFFDVTACFAIDAEPGTSAEGPVPSAYISCIQVCELRGSVGSPPLASIVDFGMRPLSFFHDPAPSS